MKNNYNCQIQIRELLVDTHRVSDAMFFNVNPSLVKYFKGDVSTSYVLSYLINSFIRFNKVTIYHTNKQISETLGISLDVVKRAKAKISKLPFIEVYTEGYLNKTYYRLKPKEYLTFLIEIGLFDNVTKEIFEIFLAKNKFTNDEEYFANMQLLIDEINLYIKNNINLKVLLTKMKEVNMKLLNNNPEEVSNKLDNSESYPHSDVENSSEGAKEVSKKVESGQKKRRGKSSVGVKTTNKIKKECINNNLLLYDNIYNDNDIYIEKEKKEKNREEEGEFEGFSIYAENDREFITAHYLRVFGRIPTFFEVKYCEDLIKEFGRDNLVLAMEQSRLQNKSALSYVKAVLVNMRDNKPKPEKQGKKKDPYSSLIEKIEKGQTNV